MRINYKIKDKLSDTSAKWLLSTISSYGFRGVSFLFTFISTPLLFKNLGGTDFGLITVFSTVLSTLSFADFGLGYYFSLVWPELKLNKNEVSIEFCSTLFFLILVSLLLILLVIVINVLPLENTILSGGSLNKLFQYKATFSLVVLITAISLPSSIMQRIEFAEQNGMLISIVNSIALILGLILIYAGIKLKFSMDFFIFTLYGITPLFWFAYLLKFLISNKVGFEKFKKNISINFLKKSFLSGISYFSIQVFNILLNSVGVFIVSNSCGIATLAILNILTKLVQVLLIPFEGLSGNFLPAMNVSLASKNISWVKRSYRMLIQFASIYTSLIVLIILFKTKAILNFWIGSKISDFELSLLFAISLFFLFRILETIVSNVMTGKILLKYSRWLYPLSVVITLFVMSGLVNKYSLTGYFTAFGLSMIFFYIIPSFIIIQKRLFQSDEWAK